MKQKKTVALTVPKVPALPAPGSGQDAQTLMANELPWVFNETSRYLETLARSAREGKNLMEAANFCRWLQFCVENNLMPPMEFRHRDRLQGWIDEQRARLARPAGRHGKGRP
jgi:hypothetical protein